MSRPQRIGNDEGERLLLANITDYGWHSVNVLEEGPNPPWTFTIGLYDTWQHPELIIIGRSRETSQHALNTVVAGLEHQHHPDLRGTTLDLLSGIPCCFVEVSPRNYCDYVGYARWYYRGKPFPLYQIVWPSNDGHYPWSIYAADSFKRWQPVLGEAPWGI
jgi:hypothetical protein